MRVLIVDDSLLAGGAMKKYFTKLGHEVVDIAKNGEQAKKKFMDHQPDLVTVDRVMPGSIDGTAVIEFINKQSMSTKIFYITSDEIPPEEKKRIKVDSYIIKPVRESNIRQAIANL